MPEPTEIRWQQRYDHLTRALGLLQRGLARDPAELSDLESEGLIQRFEYTLELAWKTLKDYLEWSGVVLEPKTPRETVKQAYIAGLIPDGAVWIAMLDRRNLLSHCYDQATFDDTVVRLRAEFLAALEQMHTRLQTERAP